MRVYHEKPLVRLRELSIRRTVWLGRPPSKK